MPVAVCRSQATGFESILMLSSSSSSSSSRERESVPTATFSQQKPQAAAELVSKINDSTSAEEKREKLPGQLDIWSSIQSSTQQKHKQEAATPEPYVHPLLRRSSGLLSQKSLEICTESLGSETGSDDFFSSDDESDLFSSCNSRQQQSYRKRETEDDANDEEEDEVEVEKKKKQGKELTAVNYHCCIRRSSPPRSFPPPLPSISRRDGPCFQMRPHRQDGRLIVQAVAVPSQNYLHAERHNGRLLLSFINTTTTTSTTAAAAAASETSENNNDKQQLLQQQEEDAQEEQEEDAREEQEEEVVAEGEEEEAVEEEEVEVVERRTVVEVKVSTQQPQLQSGASAAKVHRSSIVINKFVSCTRGDYSRRGAMAAEASGSAPAPPVRRLASTTTTTAAAAAVAASAAGAFPAQDAGHSETKLLFTSKRRNREELLHDMRRCSQLRKPLFIWEPCCIATSS